MDTFYEVVPGHLYFTTHDGLNKLPTDYRDNHCQLFNVDATLKYIPFCADFGPHNLSKLYRYCEQVNTLLTRPSNDKITVHVCSRDPKYLANAATLMGCYAIIYLHMTPDQVESIFRPLYPHMTPFRDASYSRTSYNLLFEDCVRGIHQALVNHFFDFSEFDPDMYDHYERVENGDLNWMIPDKFIAFAGPHRRFNITNGYLHLDPSHYHDYFKSNNVTDIVRLNNPMYDAEQFTSEGFVHHDLIFPDGHVPPDEILFKFIDTAENASGAIAVHCKAGLGRTGSLIGAYMMKNHQLTARETIAWLRLARPGSVIGRQQPWLEAWEQAMRKEGQALNKTRRTDSNRPAWNMAARTIDELKTKECDIPQGLVAFLAMHHQDPSSISECPVSPKQTTATVTVLSGTDVEDTSPKGVEQGDFLTERKAQAQHALQQQQLTPTKKDAPENLATASRQLKVDV